MPCRNRPHDETFVVETEGSDQTRVRMVQDGLCILPVQVRRCYFDKVGLGIIETIFLPCKPGAEATVEIKLVKCPTGEGYWRWSKQGQLMYGEDGGEGVGGGGGGGLTGCLTSLAIQDKGGCEPIMQ